jgi:hypothetical protein
MAMERRNCSISQGSTSCTVTEHMFDCLARRVVGLADWVHEYGRGSPTRAAVAAGRGRTGASGQAGRVPLPSHLSLEWLGRLSGVRDSRPIRLDQAAALVQGPEAYIWMIGAVVAWSVDNRRRSVTGIGCVSTTTAQADFLM